MGTQQENIGKFIMRRPDLDQSKTHAGRMQVSGFNTLFPEY